MRHKKSHVFFDYQRKRKEATDKWVKKSEQERHFTPLAEMPIDPVIIKKRMEKTLQSQQELYLKLKQAYELEQATKAMLNK